MQRYSLVGSKLKRIPSHVVFKQMPQPWRIPIVLETCLEVRAAGANWYMTQRFNLGYVCIPNILPQIHVPKQVSDPLQSSIALADTQTNWMNNYSTQNYTFCWYNPADSLHLVPLGPKRSLSLKIWLYSSWLYSQDSYTNLRYIARYNWLYSSLAI